MHLTFEQACELLKRQKERKEITIRELEKKTGYCDSTVFRYYQSMVGNQPNDILCAIGDALGLKITPVYIVEEKK